MISLVPQRIFSSGYECQSLGNSSIMYEEEEKIRENTTVISRQ